MLFINSLQQQTNTTTTDNGAKAYKSTLNHNLDLFGAIGASRNNLENIQRIFSLAMDEDPGLALRILFYGRDIRGGQGERQVFRHLFHYLGTEHPEIAKRLVLLVPEYGRWDDLYALHKTPSWETALNLMMMQFTSDVRCLSLGEEHPVSLLGKWLPSINASSPKTRQLGKEICRFFGLSERTYRKNLTALRKRIRIVEQMMCSKQWDKIEYDKVPSRASFMYRNAFAANDGERYKEYLASVASGEKKINASTLYPHDIAAIYLKHSWNNEMHDTLDLLWKNLPNYIPEDGFNGLVVADVSGSMHGTPKAMSIGLAIYIAERNSSPEWQGKFLTFSHNPSLQQVTGQTIAAKMCNLSRADWGMNTDLLATFRAVLDAGRAANLSNEDMPKMLLVISDMQFDQATQGSTNLEAIKQMYEEHSYTMPRLIFWNVNGNSNVPMQVSDNGVFLASGQSPSLVPAILSNKLIGPMDLVRQAVMIPRYDLVTNALNPG